MKRNRFDNGGRVGRDVDETQRDTHVMKSFKGLAQIYDDLTNNNTVKKTNTELNKPYYSEITKKYYKTASERHRDEKGPEYREKIDKIKKKLADRKKNNGSK
tara:strand:- start:381 stop:686 length:306 start_codon:yes stop_codon:yes gene_type:complete